MLEVNERMLACFARCERGSSEANAGLDFPPLRKTNRPKQHKSNPQIYNTNHQRSKPNPHNRVPNSTSQIRQRKRSAEVYGQDVVDERVRHEDGAEYE